EEWLKSLEKSYGSKEFHERRTVELSNKFMKESAMNFLKSTENVETVNIALDNIFHPNEIQGVDKKSSEAAARYYWIYESERGSKYIRIKNREIHEISKDKYRESSHSVEIEPHDPVFSVSELDIKQIEGSLGLESLMGDNLLETTNEQDEAIRDRLMQLAKEAEPGFIEIESRGGNEYWVDRAGYGKEYNGDPWVEEAYVDYSYKGKLR
ncbi:MAG: hypothetical protein Q8P54_02515, partial [bacterium]|nr:hypothetical protein [bacterium]